MNINYRQFDESDRKELSAMIQALYVEDPPGLTMSSEKIDRTITELTSHPDKGTIILLTNDSDIVGYSLLINFWSNEFGGNVLTIDELYIKQDYRSQGIGTNFIKHLIESKFAGAVGLQLEVTEKNEKARRLYEKFGFKKYKNDILMLSTLDDQTS